MTGSPAISRSQASVKIGPPAWVAGFVAGDPSAVLSSAELPAASALSAVDLQDAVRSAYGKLLGEARGRPVRCWNFVPDINGPVGGGQSRYMAFNSGRFAAFLDRLGSADEFDRQVPTASAVGVAGRDLSIFVLFVDGPSSAVDNPRQVAPHRYSQKFGKRPPCFARATRVGRHLFVGGTASIRGEESRHDDLTGQAEETVTNLEAIIRAGGIAAGFAAVSDVRVYHARSADAVPLRRLLTAPLAAAASVEFVHAELCRPELRVEVELVADAGGSTR